jgi:glycosyltransferase involved in cell wall biosynthesis
MKESVGIVIALYNQGKYLDDAIRSVIDNGDKFNVEIVIVDDKSTDDSLKIAKELQVVYVAHKIRILEHEVNRGQAAARNTGIMHLPDADYIICLDADDRLHYNYINRLWGTIQRDKVDVSYANSQMFGDQTGVYKWPEFSEANLKRGNFINCSAMFKRVVWQNSGGFDETMRDGLEDYEFWIRAFRRGFKFAKNNDTRLWWRRSGTGTTHSIDTDKEKHDKVMGYIKTKHKEWVGT